MSGEAIMDSRTAESSQLFENDSRPPWAATAVPAATASTSMVAIATVRRRRGGGPSPLPSPACSSGKL
ncbi:hypothetical protein GCM10015535_62460 [Streptomyces gelaticus]|uniref:Uncharacterized protein n=1 Tax=Streptomyces gelaticus TaxID=285446 RepID=A0ABQ2W872_9ACTN|nr:hypothetical protein GCM10015535_62460 [Streptomyces gelaticus]